MMTVVKNTVRFLWTHLTFHMHCATQCSYVRVSQTSVVQCFYLPFKPSFANLPITTTINDFSFVNGLHCDKNTIFESQKTNSFPRERINE